MFYIYILFYIKKKKKKLKKEERREEILGSEKRKRSDDNSEGYLNEFGGPKISHPHEASLRRRFPHAGDKVEHVRLSHHHLQVQNLVVMGQAAVHEQPQLVLR